MMSNDALWTEGDVQGFAQKLEAFYADLSPEGRQIFTDMLAEGVREGDDVSGYALIDGALPAPALTAAVTDYLIARAG